MLFQSTQFLTFFFVTFFLMGIFRRYNYKGVSYLFLISSYVFYSSWNKYYLILIIFSTIVDYFLGHQIFRSDSKGKKKLFLFLSIFLNLSLLGFFKYYNFFISSLKSFCNFTFDYGLDIPYSSFLLPVGISFYTFQTMSYSIDIYRDKIEPRKKIIDFAAYVAFFPQLVAGPIVRANDFFPYLDDIKISKEETFFGIGLFCAGIFKKTIIADMLAMTYVDSVFSHLSAYSIYDIMLATFGYAFQIYNDFSGYTDMAIGIGLVMGFKFPENFNYPYLSRNIREFWTRWHISLSTWLRDYLYIPLGGSRGNSLMKYRNILITMILGGLWHGASWNFVLWGLYHGVIITVSHFLVDCKIRSSKPGYNSKLASFVMNGWNYLLTFGLICFGWFLFRVESLNDIVVTYDKLFAISTSMLHVYNSDFWIVLSLAIIQQFLSLMNFKKRSIKSFVRAPVLIKAFVIAVTFVIIITFNINGVKPFIYFQF